MKSERQDQVPCPPFHNLLVWGCPHQKSPQALILPWGNSASPPSKMLPLKGFTDLSSNHWHSSLQVSLFTFIPVSLRSQPQSWNQLCRGFSLNSPKYRFDGIKLLPVIKESQNCLGWKGPSRWSCSNPIMGRDTIHYTPSLFNCSVSFIMPIISRYFQNISSLLQPRIVIYIKGHHFYKSSKNKSYVVNKCSCCTVLSS